MEDCKVDPEWVKIKISLSLHLKVNMNQMASLFGSVAIDGKRMPISITGKFLPSFKPYEANPRAGGYIPHRFMTGMDPQAYFYLCIVGRDVSTLLGINLIFCQN